MNLAPHIRNFVFRVASGIRLKAKKHAPIRSGNLKKDIQVFEHSDYFTIGNSALAPYAKFVHFGTKHIKANPYLLSATSHYLNSNSLKSATKALEKAIKEDLENGLERGL